jgi:hypothetical protein
MVGKGRIPPSEVSSKSKKEGKLHRSQTVLCKNTVQGRRSVIQQQTGTGVGALHFSAFSGAMLGDGLERGLAVKPFSWGEQKSLCFDSSKLQRPSCSTE